MRRVVERWGLADAVWYGVVQWGTVRWGKADVVGPGKVRFDVVGQGRYGV